MNFRNKLAIDWRNSSFDLYCILIVSVCESDIIISDNILVWCLIPYHGIYKYFYRWRWMVKRLGS